MRSTNNASMNDASMFWVGLRGRSWQQHLGQTLGLLWMLTLLQLLLPRAWALDLLHAMPVMLGLAIFLKELAERHETWGRARQLQRAGASARRCLRVLFAAEWRGWGNTLLGWQRDALQALLSRGSVQQDEATRLEAPAFGYLARSGYRGWMPLLLSSSLVDLVLLHGILGLGQWKISPQQALALNLGNLLLHALALSSLLGDRQGIGRGEHRLDAQHLHIDLGRRAAGRIPRQAILSATRITAGAAAPRDRHCLRVTPCAKPNVRLLLAPEARVGLWLWGSWRPALRQVDLYVDEPDALLNALAR